MPQASDKWWDSAGHPPSLRLVSPYCFRLGNSGGTEDLTSHILNLLNSKFTADCLLQLPVPGQPCRWKCSKPTGGCQGPPHGMNHRSTPGRKSSGRSWPLRWTHARFGSPEQQRTCSFTWLLASVYVCWWWFDPMGHWPSRISSVVPLPMLQRKQRLGVGAKI